MSDSVFGLSTLSLNCVDMNEDDEVGSFANFHPLSEPSSSYSFMSSRRARKFNPPDPEDMKLHLSEEIRRCHEDGECDLSKLELCAVPAGLPYFLVTLVLSDNQLTELPNGLFEGTNACCQLSRLNAQSNKLTTVPKSLLTLAKLEVLLLDHNRISYLPFDALDNTSNILPALQYVGLEFNELQRFPVEFFTCCSFLESIYLGQNTGMLETTLPTDQLVHSAVVKRLAGASTNSNSDCVTLKMDNRPHFIQQVEEEKWTTILPWLKIQWHKIYPDRVLGFVYLGSLRTAQTEAVYRDLNIGYVLTVARDLDVKINAGMKHLVLPLEDDPGENMRPLLEDAFKFIDEAKREQKNVLLHCFAGISRSATVTTAYIMSRHGMTRDEALGVIRQARPAAQPNSGFMEMLAEFEKDLRKNQVK